MHTGGPTGAFGGAPYGALKWCARWLMTNAGGPVGAFGPLWDHEMMYLVVDGACGRSQWGR
eukprot:7264552-Pyramimonas_sp.AAC.1